MNFLLIFILFITINTHEIKSQEKLKGETLNISVKGLVCDFCARSIEKLFGKEASVSDIDVNLEKMLITINLKKDKELNDKKIRKLIMDSGYDVKEINREN